MSTAKVARLLEAVVARCLAFLDSTSHSQCAQVDAWFRRLTLLPVGFPATVCIASPAHATAVSIALARMRPYGSLEIRVADFGEPGLIGALLRGQTRVRHIVLSNARAPCDSYGIDLPVDVKRAYEAREHDGRLPACRRLEVRMRPLDWLPWLPQLATRLPGLTDLDLCEFPRHDWWTLCRAAPQLTTLRIERQSDNNRRIGHDGRDAGDDSDFARHLLENLLQLRSLVLPYAMVRCADLVVAADRLESLDVLALDFGPPRLRLPRALSAPKPPPIMTRLTRLTAAICGYMARDTLEGMPYVCSGALTFQSVFGLSAGGCIVARLDHTAATTPTAMNPYGDGADGDDSGGGDACNFKGHQSVGGAGDEKRIAWSRVFADRKRSDLACSAAAAMTKLRVEWSGHDFDASMPDEECRAICERLSAVGHRSSSPPSIVAIARNAH